MKKILLACSIVTFLLVSLASCKKLVDKVFKGIDVVVPTVTVTIPALRSNPFFPVIGQEFPIAPVTMAFNLDSIIRANTAGFFNVSYVKSVKVKTIEMNLANGDDNNNLANFQSARVTIASNTVNTPTNIATINFPDVRANSLTVSPTDSPELLPYLRGSEVTYQAFGTARRETNKALTMNINVTVRVE